jgi:hypothetical protein
MRIFIWLADSLLRPAGARFANADIQSRLRRCSSVRAQFHGSAHRATRLGDYLDHQSGRCYSWAGERHQECATATQWATISDAEAREDRVTESAQLLLQVDRAESRAPGVHHAENIALLRV